MTELELLRAEKDRFFSMHPHSPLTPEQKRINDDFMAYWHEVLPRKYALADRFCHRYASQHAFPGFRRTLEVGGPDVLSYAAGHKAMGLYAMWALRDEVARIAALVGVAPLNRDSGLHQGRRGIWGVNGKAFVGTGYGDVTAGDGTWSRSHVISGSTTPLLNVAAVLKLPSFVLNTPCRNTRSKPPK